MPTVPILLNAIIDMVGKADFIHSQGYCTLSNLFHGIDRIIAELRVYMVIRKHIILPLLFYGSL